MAGSPEHDAWFDGARLRLDLKQTPPLSVASPVLAVIGAILAVAGASILVGWAPSGSRAIIGMSILGSGITLAWAGTAAFVLSRRTARLHLRLEGFIEEVAQNMDKLETRLTESRGRGEVAVEHANPEVKRPLAIQLGPKGASPERAK